MRIYLRLLKESVMMAIQALTGNKLRTFLSLMGITIGIFAIISVLTVVDSLEKNIKGSIEDLGNNVVFVQKWPWAFGGDYPWWKYINRPHPSIQEWEYINRSSQKSATSTYVVETIDNAFYKNNVIENVQLTAITEGYDKVLNLSMQDGRYFTSLEFDRGARVAILGADVARVLFRDANPLGKRMKVKGVYLTVIGVLAREGESVLGNSADVIIMLPERAARAVFNTKSDNLNPRIMVKAKEEVSNAELKDELRLLMRGVRRLSPRAEDDFALNETSLLAKGFTDFFDFIGLVGGIIGMFSVLVGGFGIANIMFVSVKERTSLIGIQKALGAKKAFILFQFLTEAIVLCVIGGAVGLGLIYLLTFIPLGSFSLSLSIHNLLIGLGISVAIGLVAGVVPAHGASRLDPVEAIRSN